MSRIQNILILQKLGLVVRDSILEQERLYIRSALLLGKIRIPVCFSFFCQP